MRVSKKILTSRGICVGVSAWTEEGKPALVVKQAKKDNYDLISIEELEQKVLKSLKTEKIESDQ